MTDIKGNWFEHNTCIVYKKKTLIFWRFRHSTWINKKVFVTGVDREYVDKTQGEWSVRLNLVFFFHVQYI